MRVGLDLNPLTLHRTGAGTFCFYILKNLLQLFPATELVGLTSGRAKADLGVLSGRVRVRHVNVPTGLLDGWWRAFRRPEVDKLLGGIEVFHATRFFLPPVCRSARVLMMHDVSFPSSAGDAGQAGYLPRMRKVAREADGLLVNSNAMKKDVVRHLDIDPAKIVVAPVGVDEELCPMLPEAARQQVERHFNIQGPFILYVGTIETQKGTVNLVRALAALAKEFPHKLVFIGPRGHGYRQVFQTAARLGVEDRVVETGYLPDNVHLRAFYSGADLFVFPAQHECFGLPVLEAMACGCPVVTSAISSMRELAGEAALYANPESVETLAASVRRALGEPATRENMTVLGQDRAKQFSWETCARITHDLYERCAALV